MIFHDLATLLAILLVVFLFVFITILADGVLLFTDHDGEMEFFIEEILADNTCEHIIVHFH
jgi:hypothetical protein